MRHTYGDLRTPIFLGASLFSIVSFVAAGWAAPQPAQQRTFATPEAAVEALIGAARGNDVGALEAVLGPGSRAVIDLGDPVEDKSSRDEFLADYEMKSNLVAVNDTTSVLQVGPSDWPLPIPLVKQGAAWHFDLRRGTRRAHQPPHRSERAQRHRGRPGLRRCAAGLCVGGSRWRQDPGICTAFHQHPRNEGWPLLAGTGGRGGESLGPTLCRGSRGRLPA